MNQYLNSNFDMNMNENECGTVGLMWSAKNRRHKVPRQKISVWPAFLCARNLFIYFDYFDFASGLGPSTNFYADDVHDL